MPTHVKIIVQGHENNVIKPIAFLSIVIEKKFNEQKDNVNNEDKEIVLEDISNESFIKFIELGEIYFGMDDKEKNYFTKDTYQKNYGRSKYYKWMNEIYNELNNEQIFSLVQVADTLDIKFLIHYLGCKLSKYIDDGSFFAE